MRRLRDGAGIDPNVLLLRGGLLLAAWAITALLSIYLNLMMLAQAFGTDTGDISRSNRARWKRCSNRRR